jgi:predicted nuclease of predicted toxin-antitoxin system
MIVTLDADFHALLATRNARAPSVLRLRLERLRGAQAAQLIERVVSVCAADLLGGAMVTVDEHRVRVRTLPLVR